MQNLIFEFFKIDTWSIVLNSLCSAPMANREWCFFKTGTSAAAIPDKTIYVRPYPGCSIHFFKKMGLSDGVDILKFVKQDYCLMKSLAPRCVQSL